MCSLLVVALFYLFLMFVHIMFLNVNETCLKLKSRLGIMCIFSTIEKLYFFIYSIIVAVASVGDAIKPNKFGRGDTFHSWQSRVRF